MERTQIITLRHAIIVAHCMPIDNGLYKKLKSPMYVGENIQNTYTDWFKDVCPAIRNIVPILVNEEPHVQVEMAIDENLLNKSDLNPLLSLIKLKNAAASICLIIIDLLSTEKRIKKVYSVIKHLYETKEESAEPATQATTNG